MDDLQLLIDLHIDGQRQGPGSDNATRRAVELSGLGDRSNLAIADIGCGTGASTLVLARDLEAHIVAVDRVPEFLSKLEDRASNENLAACITPCTASMQTLPFAESQFDAIWSEGAIYNMGFAAGIKAWRQYLKPGGILAVSELTWLTHQRPQALQDYWDQEYPEVDTASSKMKVLEDLGFAPIGYFALPEDCWLNNYYRPLQARFPAFLDRNNFSDAAKALVQAEEEEIALYEKYKTFVSYGFYIAQRTSR